MIIKLVEELKEKFVWFVCLVDCYVVFFILIVYLIGGIFWWFLKDFLCFVEVLVVVLFCLLILVVLIVLVVGMSCLSKNGIVVKIGIMIEKFVCIKMIVFDKIGMFIKGILEVEVI